MRTGRPKSSVRNWNGERSGSGPLSRTDSPSAGRARELGVRAAGDASAQPMVERWDVLCSHLYKCRCCVART